MDHKYYLDYCYMEVHENFVQSNGERSYYDMMFGSGIFTIEEFTNRKEAIEEIINKLEYYVHYEIRKFQYKETESGLEFHRYVKCIDLDKDEFIDGTPDDYTDHEEYIVNVFKVEAKCGIDSLIEKGD